jgi:uncharacterized protein YggE
MGRSLMRKALVLATAVVLALAVKVAAQPARAISSEPGAISPEPLAQPVQSSNPARTIDVVGHGEASAKPDTMIVSFVAESEAPEADKATELQSGKTRKIVDALKAKLGSGAKIETSQFSLTQQYPYQPVPMPVPTAEPEAAPATWDCKIDVAAFAPSIGQLGALVDAGMAAGATRVQASGLDIWQEGDGGFAVSGGRFSSGAVGQPNPTPAKPLPGVTLEIESQGATADEATRHAFKTAGKVEHAFKQKLQGTGQVRVVGFNIARTNPIGLQNRPPWQIPPPPPPPRAKSWQAHTTITARTRDLDVLGPLIEAGMKAGATRLERVTFTLAEDSAASRRAIKKASEDAKNKATALAHSMGIKLGKVIRVSTNASAEPQVIYGREMLHSFRASSEAMPVMPRQIGYTATVSVTYQIE